MKVLGLNSVEVVRLPQTVDIDIFSGAEPTDREGLIRQGEVSSGHAADIGGDRILDADRLLIIHRLARDDLDRQRRLQDRRFILRRGDRDNGVTAREAAAAFAGPRAGRIAGSIAALTRVDVDWREGRCLRIHRPDRRSARTRGCGMIGLIASVANVASAVVAMSSRSPRGRHQKLPSWHDSGAQAARPEGVRRTCETKEREGVGWPCAAPTLIAEWSRSESLRRPASAPSKLRSVAGPSDGWRRKANNASGPQRKQYNADRRRNKEASAGGADENAAKAVAMMLFVMRRFGTGSALRADDAVMHVESGGRPGK